MRTIRNRFDEKVLTDGVSVQGLTIYHRTGAKEGTDISAVASRIKKILDNGFAPGDGKMYGRGLYATTDRASQMAQGMTLAYGLGMIKYAVPIKGFFVLDYNIAGALWGTGTGKSGHPSYSIVEQCVRYGLWTDVKLIPPILIALSVDLECTFGMQNRKLSADRADKVFAGCLIQGNNITSVISSLRSLDPAVKDLYVKAGTSARIKDFDKYPKVAGTVFSGNHDGNVIVCYKLNTLKPLMWGISDPNNPTDPKSWAVPMTPVGKNITAGNLSQTFRDVVTDEGISSRGTLASAFVEGMAIDTMGQAVKDLRKLSPWLFDRRNIFSGLCFAVSRSGKNYVYDGEWIQGVFEGTFGADSVVIAEVSKMMRGGLIAQNFFPTFSSGTFVGDYFSGNFSGGVFSKGLFNGVFNGGLWKYSPDATWGKNAVFTSSSKHYIEYEGALYDLNLPPEEWVAKRIRDQATLGGSQNYVDERITLADNIKNSLPFETSTFAISNTWGAGKTTSDKFREFKSRYEWLWNKGIKWTASPDIMVDSRGVLCVRGVLLLGTVQFDAYSKSVDVNGGVIRGDNLFLGAFRGGVYEEGAFDGTWFGGVWNSDRAKWFSNATLVNGTMIGRGKPIPNTTTIQKGKIQIPIVEVAFLTWKTIPDLLKAVEDGSYVALTQSLKKRKKRPADLVKDVVGLYKKNSFTAADLLKIVNDDSEDDDIAALHSSVAKGSLRSTAEALNELLCHQNRERFINRFFEKEFRYGDLSPEEQDLLYEEFKASYVKATGASFDHSAFERRADNWTFFGDAPNDSNPDSSSGGVAVRRQQSNGMYKLVASFGGFKSIIRGFLELNQKHGKSPIWGDVTPEILKMIVRFDKNFKVAPGLVAKAMEGGLKKLFGGDLKSVGLDGSLMIDTPAGVMKKYFVANKVYWNWLLDSVTDEKNASRLPVPQAIMKPLIGMIKALL